MKALAVLVAVFAVVTLVAELAGAANLGTALTFGQMAFAAVLVWLLTRE
ncbi:MAG TPA: hypothetical protein VFZ89_15235 [Solirubrobacteraceae bacterium]